MEERGQMAEALSPKLLRAGIERAIARFNLGEGLALNAQERAILADDVQDEIAGLGPLEPLLRDPEIDDVIANGATRAYVEPGGQHGRAAWKVRGCQYVSVPALAVTVN